MPLLVKAYLTPNAFAVKFAIKTTLAMLIALYVAFLFDLERPYWALISAAFLQVRPMSGMVIEKGLCQLIGTFVGAMAGIVIMSLFSQARIPALLALTLWIILCTYVGSLWRNNYTYGCLMAAVTAMLIVVISSGSSPAGIFDIAVARLAELGLGAICATLVSALLWPSHVGQHLITQADTTLSNAFRHAMLRLSLSPDAGALQKSLRNSLDALVILEADSQAARFEGPQGPGRLRATHVLTQRTVRLMANVHALHQLLNRQADRLSPASQALAYDAAKSFQEAEQTQDLQQARQQLQQLRHRVLADNSNHRTSIDLRFSIGLRETLGHALVMLDARTAIASPSAYKLRSPPLAWHRDHFTAGINALRAGAVFAALASLWILTAWNSAMIAMMLGTLFSAFFASRDNPVEITLVFYKGMLAAIPSALVFGHVLLSQVNGFPLLALILGTPLFLGLLGATNPATMGYCLAFTVFNILLTMPGNGMDFSMEGFANRVIAAVIGLTTVVMSFRLLLGQSIHLRRTRLVKAISRDLHTLGKRPIKSAEARFSGKMADRLLQLAHHDDTLPQEQRHLFILGFTGLDVGIAILHLRDQLDSTSHPMVRRAHSLLLRALAAGFAGSAQGTIPHGIGDAGKKLNAALSTYEQAPPEQLILLAGLVERLELSLDHLAHIMADTATAAISA